MNKNKLLWPDWLMKHENDQETMRIAEDYADTEEFAYSVSLLLSDMVGCATMSKLMP